MDEHRRGSPRPVSVPAMGAVPAEETHPPGTVLAVDTADLDEIAERLRRAADDLRAAGEGLAQLSGVGVLGVGADAVFDAVSDLGRQWCVRSEDLDSAASTLRRSFEGARQAYEQCEGSTGNLMGAPWGMP